MDWSVRTKDVTAQRVLALRTTCSLLDWEATVQDSLATVWQFLDTRFASVTVGPALARIERRGAGMCEVVAGFPVRENAPAGEGMEWIEFGATSAATLVHQGPYERLAESRDKLQDWSRRERIELSGDPWFVFWVDPDQVDEPDELRTELVWPIQSPRA